LLKSFHFGNCLLFGVALKLIVHVFDYEGKRLISERERSALPLPRKLPLSERSPNLLTAFEDAPFRRRTVSARVTVAGIETAT